MQTCEEIKGKLNAVYKNPSLSGRVWSQWTTGSLATCQTTKTVPSAVKVMAATFWDLWKLSPRQKSILKSVTQLAAK